MTEENEMLAFGEKVTIRKKSTVVDESRTQEGYGPPEDRRPINQDVTGQQGQVCGESYESPLKDGESCVPIRLRNGAIVGVPESRLGRGGAGKPRTGWTRKFAGAWLRIFGQTKG